VIGCYPKALEEMAAHQHHLLAPFAKLSDWQLFPSPACSNGPFDHQMHLLDLLRCGISVFLKLIFYGEHGEKEVALNA
jgi:hypothetical protein